MKYEEKAKNLIKTIKMLKSECFRTVNVQLQKIYVKNTETKV